MHIDYTRKARKRFARVAHRYQNAAFLQTEIAKRLLNRLELMKLQPKTILDCGARTGFTSEQLRRRYVKARVISYDFCASMLAVKQQRWWQKRLPKICGNYAALPFQSHSFDLIYSNLALHWTNNIESVIQEFTRVLKPNGLILLSTLGPDTLQELRYCGFSTKNFVDMHIIGDWMLHAGLHDPVMDRENLQLQYENLNDLFSDLKNTGVNESHHTGLVGNNRWQRQLKKYQETFGLSSTIEVVYGHAFGRHERGAQNGEVMIPISSIRKNQ